MLIVVLALALGALVYYSVVYNITGWEFAGLIFIAVIAIFTTVTVHALITQESATRQRDRYVPQKQVRL